MYSSSRASVSTTDSDTISQASGSSRKHRDRPQAYGNRYRFSSGFEFVLMVLVYSSSVGNYNRIMKFSRQEPNIIQVLACFLLIGMPIQYMQVVLGQYTQLSGTYFKSLSPIGHGMGYAFLINSMFRILPNAILAGDFLLYLLNCMQSQLPWLSCSKYEEETCWEGPTCTKPGGGCLSNDVHVSAYYYWNFTYMKVIPEEPEFVGFDLRRMVMMVVTWGILITCLVQKSALIKKIIKYMFITAIAVVIILGTGLLCMGGATIIAMKAIVDVKISDFVEFELWLKSMQHVISILNLSRGGHILHGSYINPTSSSGIYTVLGCAMHGMLIFVFMVLYHAALGILVKHAELDESSYDVIFNANREPFEFTAVVNGIGFSSNVPQLWSILYFLASILISITYVLANIQVMEVNLEDIYPSFFKYRKYALTAFTVLSIICSLVFVWKGIYVYSTIYYKCVIDAFDMFLIFLFTGTVAWIYGVQRLCDDVHFIMGSQPTKFWRICWYICPVPVGVCSLFLFSQWDYQPYELFGACIVVVLLSPMLVMAVVEVFRYIKKRNLIGLFQPDERWGPPDPNERHLRQVFNPRKEIRSRRRNDNCQHKCLLNSQMLKKIIAEEVKFQMFLTDRGMYRE